MTSSKLKSFKKNQASKKKYLTYFKKALTRSKRGEVWSMESLPIVIVDKSEITGTRRTTNEPLSDRLKIAGSSVSCVLQGKNK